jgi:hypothetical protein
MRDTVRGGRASFMLVLGGIVSVSAFHSAGIIGMRQQETTRGKFGWNSARILCSVAKPPGTSSQIRAPVFGKPSAECAYTGITLTRYMRDVSRENPELRELEDLISGIQQVIAKYTQTSRIWNLLR